MNESLILLKGTAISEGATSSADVVPFEDLKRELLRGAGWRRFLHYNDVRVATPALGAMSKPFATALAARLLSRGSASIIDEEGKSIAITGGLLLRWLVRLARDASRRSAYLRAVERLVDARITECESGHRAPAQFVAGRSPLYLRTDFSRGLRAGGSVAHTAGVLNQLERVAGAPIFVTTARMPLVSPGLETHVLPSGTAFTDFAELPLLSYNDVALDGCRHALATRVPSFIYQRYVAQSFAGSELARELRIPFVLEYNGSEIWVSRHWARPFLREQLAVRIESLNLRSADLVVVVSDAIREELAASGESVERVLVNPNGVDPDLYSLAVDGSAVRSRFGFGGEVVIGFIGTFGPWHGAEVLAEALVRLLADPERRASVRALWIGDGARRPAAERIMREAGLGEVCVFTGLVPQEAGPEHLAACDILVAPHVPNADGSRFFGSPTKLFEYMAMGKAIVASELEQLGEILEHGRTAWLVPPADAGALADGLVRLLDDASLRRRLGPAAREEVVRKFTWERHTRRIVDRLRELCEVPPVAERGVQSA